MNAFSNSTIVLDNPPAEGSREFGPDRQGQERYISWIPDWSQFLIVPVVLSLKPVSRIGAPTVEAPVRVALSAYPSPEIPPGNIIWQMSTDTKSK